MSMSQSPKNSCHKNPFHSPKNKKNRRIVETTTNTTAKTNLGKKYPKNLIKNT